VAVLTLAVAKSHLRITTANYDTILPDWVASAEATIAQQCGPLEPTSTTDRLHGWRDALALKTTPAISLTSVTPASGGALTIGDLYLDQAAGVVTFNNGASFVARYYDVTYSAGRTTCPPDLLMAVKELLRHLWGSAQRGGGGRPGSAGSDSPDVPGAPYLLPDRVRELMAPHLQAGFA
jgi:hypothetical protein